MFSGQAANSFSQGLMQGYAFADKAVGAKQDREIKQQQAKQQAEIRTEQIRKQQRDNNIYDEMYADANPQTQINQVQQDSQKLQEEVKAQGQKMNGMNIDMDINGLSIQSTIKDRDEYLKTVNAKIKANPQAYSSLKLQGKLEVLNHSSSDDRSWMTSHLVDGRGITPESLDLNLEDEADKAIWEKVIDKSMDIYPVIKEGKNIVDMNELGIATGSINKALPAVRKQIEANMEIRQGELERVVQEERVGADAIKAKANTPEGETPKIEGELTEVSATDEELASYRETLANATGRDKLNPTRDLSEYKSNEGFRGKAYKDTEGNMTIGYGHKIKPNEKHLLNTELSKEEAEALLAKDVESHDAGLLKNEPWVADLPQGQQEAVKDMAFNMGADFLDKKFPSLKKALQTGDTQRASEIIKGSKYARQVGARADRNISKIMGGEESKGGAPLDDTRMRKLYAIVGRKYPTDDNNTASDRKGMSRDMKVIRDIEVLRGEGKNKEADLLEKGLMKRSDKRTATKYAADLATEQIKEYDKTGYSNLSDEEKADYHYQEEAVQEYTQSTKEQNNQAQKVANADARASVAEFTSKLSGKEEITQEDKNNLMKAQETQRRNTDSLTKKGDDKILATMRANQEASKELANALGRMKDGDLQDMETGVFDNAVQYMGEKIVSDYISDDRQKTIEANIKAKSTLGYLQATLIKAMSGTAAGEAEVKRLQDVMQGNSWNQPEAIKVALEDFYKNIGRRQKTLGGQLRVSPYDKYDLSDMGELGSSKTIPKKGETYNDQKVVGVNSTTGEFMLEDGTVVGGK